MKPESKLYGIEDIVAELQARGFDITELETLSWLRGRGYLVGEKSGYYNAPSAACLELGWMIYQRTWAQGSGGRLHVELRPMLTTEGCNALLPRLIRYINDRNEGKDVYV